MNEENVKIHFRYLNTIFPFVAPYLLPALNTLMTCSVYGTVAVALNRYLEMTEKFKDRKWLKNGKIHCLAVLLFSILFNFTRWFELEFVQENGGKNVTLKATDLRYNENYIRWYSCIINSIVMIVIPTFVLVFTTYKVSKLLKVSNGLSDERSKARAKRNQSITTMLVGIIVMFLLCHTGKVIFPHFWPLFYTFFVFFSRLLEILSLILCSNFDLKITK